MMEALMKWFISLSHVVILVISVSILIVGCNQAPNVQRTDEITRSGYPFGADSPGEVHNYVVGECWSHFKTIGYEHYLDKNGNPDWEVITASFDSVFTSAVY
jgi:hypothetical protein